MTYTHGLSIAALIAALAVTPVFANGRPDTSLRSSDHSADGDHGPQQTPGKAGGAAPNTGRVPEPIGKFGDFVAALDKGQLGARGVVAERVTNVRTVYVTSEFADFDEGAFRSAIERDSAALRALRAALQSDEQMKNLLTGNNVSLSDIVGIDSTQDGTLLIYLDSHG